ncbi:hypothetical protein HG530_014202 [Fusarium avenaceum]|nr:hypothetical protein HG530_014202 [Fusarium avenaceum]
MPITRTFGPVRYVYPHGVKTPSPIQPKMVSNCKKFHQVTSTTTCTSIQKYYKIALAQLVKWNPTIGKGFLFASISYSNRELLAGLASKI